MDPTFYLYRKYKNNISNYQYYITLEGNNLVVNFVIGKKTIDISDAVVMPIPEDVNHNIIRVGGTSVGKKHSGNFMNTKTKVKYQFYLTGKGKRTYFEIGNEKYLVDGIDLK